MENRKKQFQGGAWMSVPQFGAWEHKAPGATNYSMVFTQARANRKQQKAEFNRSSLGNEEELAARVQDDSVVRKKKILTYLNCCIRP